MTVAASGRYFGPDSILPPRRICPTKISLIISCLRVDGWVEQLLWIDTLDALLCRCDFKRLADAVTEMANRTIERGCPPDSANRGEADESDGRAQTRAKGRWRKPVDARSCCP